jgi:hypothetical protein
MRGLIKIDERDSNILNLEAPAKPYQLLIVP